MICRASGRATMAASSSATVLSTAATDARVSWDRGRLSSIAAILGVCPEAGLTPMAVLGLPHRERHMGGKLW
jgi:hypothetical protein